MTPDKMLTFLSEQEAFNTNVFYIDYMNNLLALFELFRNRSHKFATGLFVYLSRLNKVI